jgi:hypothetical protein
MPRALIAMQRFLSLLHLFYQLSVRKAMLFHVSITLLYRDNTVLYFMNIYSSQRLKVAFRHSPRFPLEQKRREHVQEALVKETGWNDGVAGPEQRGVLSVGRDVRYTTVKRTLLALISFHQ